MNAAEARRQLNQNPDNDSCMALKFFNQVMAKIEAAIKRHERKIYYEMPAVQFGVPAYNAVRTFSKLVRMLQRKDYKVRRPKPPAAKFGILVSY